MGLKRFSDPDTRRIDWYRQVLAELARAIADGAQVRAYHAWSLLDNFQWAEAHTERYGLVYTDFRNQNALSRIQDSGIAG
jgi:beta-glucosidase